MLFVEPPADVLFDIRSRRIPTPPRFRRLSKDGRLVALRPLKPFPRRFGRAADVLMLGQVKVAARALRLLQPTLWINDVTFAPLISETGWSTVYDITDDWLLAPFLPRELARLTRLDDLALTEADEVVVCSPALAASRGLKRDVSVVPNGVDVEHFRRARPRPSDLPDSPTAVYVGSLHDARIDVRLVVELAAALPRLTVVLVGPNSLEMSSRLLLEQTPNVVMLGPRPYRDVPGYLQHADAIVVPHLVSPFTESLDPIKAYECLTVDTPTVATPVAGFREHSATLNIVDRAGFVRCVERVISGASSRIQNPEPVGWEARAIAFERILDRAWHGPEPSARDAKGRGAPVARR